MIIGTRIEERLGAARLSQSELARRVHLSQSTINGLIKGEQRSTTKLPQIARELATTPAYLLGETDDPNSDAPDAPQLNYEQLELIDCFDRLSRADQQALLQIARSMAGHVQQQKPSVHSPPVGFRAETADRK